jgi:hypothetical protein
MIIQDERLLPSIQIHGNGVLAEDLAVSQEIVRRGWGAAYTFPGQIEGGHPHRDAWFQFVIPTEQPCSLGGVLVLFKTDQAVIKRVDVWDGDQPLLRHETSLKGDYSQRHVLHENVLLIEENGFPRNVYRGVVVSILAGPTRVLAGTIEFVSVGAGIRERVG